MSALRRKEDVERGCGKVSEWTVERQKEMEAYVKYHDEDLCQIYFGDSTMKVVDVIDMLTAISALTARAEAAEARAKELEAASRWIPVSERLPQEAQEVIVISSNGYVCKWFHTNQMRQAFLTHWTHWRPFEPPQEGKE